MAVYWILWFEVLKAVTLKSIFLWLLSPSSSESPTFQVNISSPSSGLNSIPSKTPEEAEAELYASLCYFLLWLTIQPWQGKRKVFPFHFFPRLFDTSFTLIIAWFSSSANYCPIQIKELEANFTKTH
jgi:hypothetical protein